MCIEMCKALSIEEHKEVTNTEMVLNQEVPCWNTSYVYEHERTVVDECLKNIKKSLRSKIEEKQRNEIITDSIRKLNRIIKRWNKGIISKVPSGIIITTDRFGSFEYKSNYQEF